MNSTQPDSPMPGRRPWVKQFNLIFWEITIDNGSYYEFIKARYAFGGYSETQTYSRPLWIVISLATIILLFIGSSIFIVLGFRTGFGEAEMFGIVFLLVAIGYGYLFYRWTYVPPK